MAVLLAVVLPRMLVAQVSVIDWDESIFALVAQQWVEGHVPYATAFDHKPIGLYGVFALFFLVFGDTILAMRLIPIVFVAATALLIARLVEAQFGRDRLSAGAAAAIYGLLTLANGGLATNTELLINFFIVLAIYLMVVQPAGNRLSFGRCLAIGVALGMAFQVNYLAGILIAGVAAFRLCWVAGDRPVSAMLLRYFLEGAAMLLGLLLVSVLLLLPVLLYGDIRDYFGLQLAYLIDYQRDVATAVVIRRVSEALIPYWPFYALALLLAAAAAWPWRPSGHVREIGQSSRDRRILAWIVLGAFALAAAVASGYYFHHFFLLSVPSLVMIAAGFLRSIVASERLRIFAVAWLLLMAASTALHARQEIHLGLRAHAQAARGQPADSVARVGEYLTERLAPGEQIYVFDGQPILYFLTRTVPPTRFAFPMAHQVDHIAQGFGFTPYDKVKEIFAVKPRFVIARPRSANPDRSAMADLLYDTLDRDYQPVAAADERAPTNVFELIRRQ